MHYQPHVDFAFYPSVEHIMRMLMQVYIIRYCHANVAYSSYIFVYLHIGRSYITDLINHLEYYYGTKE